VDRPTRFEHRAELRAIVEPIFRERTVAEWMARLEAADVLCTPVNDFASLPRDAQVRAGGMLIEEEHPRAGRFTTLGPALRFTQTPGTLRTGAPALGEHTDAVLGEAGLSPDERHHLRAQRVIG
jgi:crotonobetainyl-CoA:carnitine CoA-transferase CaiB-like acyl-CoA transferase